MATDSISRKIEKIEGLLKLAADPNTTQAERELAQSRAEAIMFQHRIDRATLFSTQSSAGLREIIVRKYDTAGVEEFVSTANWMRSSFFTHMGCLTLEAWRNMTVVGYEEDIQMAEMLWAGVFLHFTRTIFPKWENYKTFDANVYDLKSAGYSWPYVRDEGLKREAGDHVGKLTHKNSGSKLRSAFKREAGRRGETVSRQPIQFKKWRMTFADAYASRLNQRLREMREKNEAEAGETGVLALTSEQDRLKQKFYELFPEMNPEERKRRVAEAQEAERVRRASLTQEERDKEDAAEEKRRTASNKRYLNKTPHYDEGGWSAGIRAADRADLGRERVESNIGKELE